MERRIRMRAIVHAHADSADVDRITRCNLTHEPEGERRVTRPGSEAVSQGPGNIPHFHDVVLAGGSVEFNSARIAAAARSLAPPVPRLATISSKTASILSRAKA